MWLSLKLVSIDSVVFLLSFLSGHFIALCPLIVLLTCASSNLLHTYSVGDFE